MKKGFSLILAGHWDPLGNHAAAEAIYDYLVNMGYNDQSLNSNKHFEIKKPNR